MRAAELQPAAMKLQHWFVKSSSVCVSSLSGTALQRELNESRFQSHSHSTFHAYPNLRCPQPPSRSKLDEFTGPLSGQETCHFLYSLELRVSWITHCLQILEADSGSLELYSYLRSFSGSSVGRTYLLFTRFQNVGLDILRHLLVCIYLSTNILWLGTFRLTGITSKDLRTLGTIKIITFGFIDGIPVPVCE